jgi:hypothetical protein
MDHNLFGEPITPEPEPEPVEEETRGQQVALIEWIGLEQETYRR